MVIRDSFIQRSSQGLVFHGAAIHFINKLGNQDALFREGKGAQLRNHFRNYAPHLIGESKRGKCVLRESLSKTAASLKSEQKIKL